MRSQHARNLSGRALLGLAIGVAAGIATGLVAAPMRGGDLRAAIRDRAVDGRVRLRSLASSTRAWAQQTVDRGRQAVDEARRAYHAGHTAASEQRLTAPLGEIASLHSGTRSSNWEARS